MTTQHQPGDADLLGCAGVARNDNGLPTITGTADIRRFAECVRKNWPAEALGSDDRDQLRAEIVALRGTVSDLKAALGQYANDYNWCYDTCNIGRQPAQDALRRAEGDLT